MKCKVVNVERVQFSNGTISHKVFAIAENNCMGCFYTTQECKVGDLFELSLSTDNKQAFSVRKSYLGDGK